MTTPIDISNRALSAMGARATIASFSDPNPASVTCGLWYDKLRRQLLRSAPWGFSRRQLSLTQLGDLIPDLTAPYPWLYKYAYPSDCLKLRYLLTPPLNVNNSVAPAVGLSVGPNWWGGPSRENRFIVANDVIAPDESQKVLVSNVCGAIGVYNGDITDPDQWDDLFEGALTSALAYNLVMPLSGNVGLRSTFKQDAMDAITQARVADGNESITKADVQVDWIRTRGVGSVFGYPADFIGTSWGVWTEGWSNMNWSS